MLFYTLCAALLAFVLLNLGRAWLAWVLPGALLFVGWGAEFFTGRPNWRRLLNFQPKELSPKEQAFLDGPCEKVCAMLTDWEVNQKGDLTKEVWEFIKHQGFMGMIIPEEFGGLGFS